MDIIEQFEAFVRDFEEAVLCDRWSKLEAYFAGDATYVNVGGSDPKCRGRKAIVDYLKADVSATDNRFDTRTLTAMSLPLVDGNRLVRQWRMVYTLSGAPDLVLEGEARYLFEEGLIKTMEEEPTPASMLNLQEWMQMYGQHLPVVESELKDE